MGDLLGGLGGVGEGDGVAGWGGNGIDEEAIGVDIVKDRPADVVDGVAVGLGELGLFGEFDLGLALVGEADDVAEAGAIGRGGGLISGDAAGEVLIDGFDHLEGEITGAGEGLGAREGGGEEEGGEDHRPLMIFVPGK